MDLFMLGLLQKMSRGGGGGKSVSHSSSYTINNTVDYPLVGLNLYGKSTQNGTPTPENPVEIVSVGDSGFDIISKNDKHFNILSVRDNGGEIITKQPVSTAAKAGKNFLFTVVATGTGLTYQWQYSNDNGTTWTNSVIGKTAVFSATAVKAYNGYLYRCVVTDNSGKSVISDEATLYVFADDCEVKTASIVTDALPLCGIPVESGGNYTDSNGNQWICDELIYNADGTGKIIKRINEIIFNGSEDWKLSGNGKSVFLILSDDIKVKFKSNLDNAEMFSNKYVAGSYNDYYHATKTCISTAENGAIVLYDERFVGNIEALKADIVSNNLRDVYDHATPQEIELTSEEMTELMQLQTFDGVTNISNKSGADMDVKYCTDKSLSECVLPITMGLQKQIDELRVYVQKQIDEIEAGILTPGILIIPGSYAETISGPIITEGDE